MKKSILITLIVFCTYSYSDEIEDRLSDWNTIALNAKSLCFHGCSNLVSEQTHWASEMVTDGSHKINFYNLLKKFKKIRNVCIKTCREIK